MSFEPFAVVVVPFPFTDRASEKRRPALVLSAAAFGTQAGHSVLAMISSQRADRPAWPLDTPIRDLAASGLPAPSLVRMKLFTLDHRLILRVTGLLSKRDQRAVRTSLRALLPVVAPA